MKGIVIAGGGLAGLSLGIALRRHGVPVIVREASSYPRHRVCGEFINGVTEKTLGVLGISDLFKDALRHHSTRWWMGNTQILKAELSRPAFGMSRWEMDERLRVTFQEAGGDLRTHDRAKPVPCEGLVWAAGRFLEKESPLLGLKAHFEGLELSGFLEMHIGEGSYLGLTPITADGSRVNVCGLFKRGPRTAGENPIVDALRRSGLGSLAERVSSAHMVPKSLTGISGVHLGSQGATDDLCSLGDAERMIPPFTGNGMSMAFESAECALGPLLDYCAEERTWDESRSSIRSALDYRFRSRVRFALGLHYGLMHRAGRAVLTSASSAGIIPFQWLHQRLS